MSQREEDWTKEKTYKITSCARCGNDHEGIIYRKLTNPMLAGGVILTHWALCPELGEPIMMYFIDVPEGVDKDKKVEIDR